MHNVVELCTAVKPTAAKLLASRYEKVMYIDPDIAVFDSLSSLFGNLDSADVLLTPHQLVPCEPVEQKLRDIELCSLMHGVFNLGFFAIRSSGEGLRFLWWWESRVLKFCYEDIASGIFTDQKWCDIAPCYFPTLYIVRDYGCNLASWNLDERDLSFANDKILVNGKWSLKFYHFTKYGGVGEIMTRRYAKNTLVSEVWFWYGRRLKSLSSGIPGNGRYYYGYYDDGTKIDDADRVRYRKSNVRVPNPYIKSEFRSLS